MKLFALALDYDGTIATNDRLDPLVRDAIAAARRRNIAVILVTGRILDELRRVAGDLHFVDAVIAENGALLPHRSVIPCDHELLRFAEVGVAVP